MFNDDVLNGLIKRASIKSFIKHPITIGAALGGLAGGTLSENKNRSGTMIAKDVIGGTITGGLLASMILPFLKFRSPAIKRDLNAEKFKKMREDALKDPKLRDFHRRLDNFGKMLQGKKVPGQVVKKVAPRPKVVNIKDYDHLKKYSMDLGFIEELRKLTGLDS